MTRVFLGGTCTSNWRDTMEQLLNRKGIDYFNPIVSDWNVEAQKQELYERATCDYCLFVITPKMEGLYSIAEVVDDSNKRPERTIFVVLNSDDGQSFNDKQIKSLASITTLVESNDGQIFTTLEEAANYMAKGGPNESNNEITGNRKKI